MKSKSKWMVNGAAAGALMLTLGAPAFAQSRGDWNRNDSYRNDSQRTSNYRSNYRDNQRVTLSGRVTSFTRERDGYRVRLDRGDDVWVPERSFGSHARDLRVGVSISLGGVYRGGTIYADAVNWPDTYAYRDAFVRGVVARVDYRDRTVWVREEGSGRLVAARMPNRRDVRRGEFVELRAL